MFNYNFVGYLIFLEEENVWYVKEEEKRVVDFCFGEAKCWFQKERERRELRRRELRRRELMSKKEKNNILRFIITRIVTFSSKTNRERAITCHPRRRNTHPQLLECAAGAEGEVDSV